MLALASALVFAVLTCHWLYLCAQNIESQPTPAALTPAVLRLSVFQALILGAFVVPVGVTVIYYLLSALIWSLSEPESESLTEPSGGVLLVGTADKAASTLGKTASTAWR